MRWWFKKKEVTDLAPLLAPVELIDEMVVNKDYEWAYTRTGEPLKTTHFMLPGVLGTRFVLEAVTASFNVRRRNGELKIRLGRDTLLTYDVHGDFHLNRDFHLKEGEAIDVSLDLGSEQLEAGLRGRFTILGRTEHV